MTHYQAKSYPHSHQHLHRQPVLFSHDGGIDDFLALLLLTTLEDVELVGVIVTPADCYLEPALRVSHKILRLRGMGIVPVIPCPVQGVNPFPSEYRRDCWRVERLPILNEHPAQYPTESLSPTDGVKPTDRQNSLKPILKPIGQILHGASRPVTWLETGPLTSLAKLSEADPDIWSAIHRVVWMGGAINTSGNVEAQFAPQHDGSAEWNAFWDPGAVEVILQHSQTAQVPVTICPLDATHQVPVNTAWLDQLAQQHQYFCSDLAGQCYALAISQDYYCWDVLTATYLGAPELFEIDPIKIAIATQGASQGRTDCVTSGYPVQVIQPKSPERIRAYLLQQWAC